MFIFGHLGIGGTLARPWRKRLPWLPLFAGMLLPDIIDKPLYYARISHFFSCTRTVGHTVLLVALVLALAGLRRSKGLAALALGMSTHIVLDCALGGFSRDSSAVVAAAWPLMGPFVESYSASLVIHLRQLLVAPVMLAEVVGLALLVWEWRRRATKPS